MINPFPAAFFLLGVDVLQVGLMLPPNDGVYVASGASLDLNFASGAVDSRITYTGSNGTYYDATGTMQTAVTNVPRIDYGPAPFVTNYIRNNTMVGAVAGTPGTLPTNWGNQSLGSLVQTVVGTGTESGIPYIDIQISGTSNTTGVNFNTDGFAAIAPVLQGQVWAMSCYLRLVGGSFANVTDCRMFMNETGTSGYLGTDGTVPATFPLPTTASLVSQRISGIVTVAPAGTNSSQPWVGFEFSSGAAINFTIRIGAPQLELAATAGMVVLTSGNVVSAPVYPTNWIRNNSMIGAVVPNTFPNNWGQNVYYPTNGCTRTVVGTGIENGLPYVDINTVGTGNTDGWWYFSPDTAGASASPGQVWTYSMYARLVGGTLNGVTAVATNVFFLNAGGAEITRYGSSAGLPTNSPLSTQRIPATSGAAPAGTVFASPQIMIYILNGQAIDFTIRIGAPQLEQGSVATNPILTSGSAANAGATPLGLLIEESRTNSVLQSANMTALGWGPNGTAIAAPTLTAGAGIAPDGTTNATRFVMAAVGTAGFVSVIFQAFTTSAASYSTSIWLRGAVGGEQVWLTLQTPAYTAQLATLTTAWQRFTIPNIAFSATTTYLEIGTDLRTGSGNSATSAQTFYAWGAQLELGAFATSYIPTTSAAVTRAADVATMPVGSWYNAAAGTLVAEVIIPSFGPALYYGASVKLVDGGGSNQVSIVNTQNDIYGYEITAGAGSQTPNYTFVAGSVFRVGLSYVAGGTLFYTEGGQTGYSLSNAPTVPLVSLVISQGAFDGYIRRIRYWGRAQGSGELIRNTT